MNTVIIVNQILIQCRTILGCMVDIAHAALIVTAAHDHDNILLCKVLEL